jgi:glyoxylase-like metal-dependent hydrolase (beta-lactamase superfamily II)
VLTPIPIHAGNPGPMTGDGNWTWLLQGRVPTLIDAGTGEASHLEALERALDGSPLAQVLVTHAHVDHASGVTAIHRRFPDAAFYKTPWPERDATWPVAWRSLADQQIVDAGDTTVEALHTPGHAPDHLCFWHRPSRSVFCGDLAVKGTTVWIPPSLRGDLAAYLASLARIRDLDPRRLYPGHGPVIDDPVRLLQQYIDHRHEREQQVIAAMRLGDATPAAMVERIYKGLRPQLAKLAEQSVLAHLIKLEREGRARRLEDRWLAVE